MNYQGTIIEESLHSSAILGGMHIVSTRTEPVTARHRTPHIKQWTLHDVEIPEDQADELAEQLSRVLRSGEPHDNWYADYRNSAYHYVIFKGKVFKLDRSKKQDYEKMIAYGLSLGIPDYQLPNLADLPIDVLEVFLRATRANGYANEKVERATPLRPKSKYYHFEQGDLTYHDTYFGGTKFIGEEVVYKNDRPAWGMNYYGFTMDDTVSEDLYDAILRPALMSGSGDNIPVRGPKHFVNGDYTYTFNAVGSLASFTGVEEISRDSRVICKLYCHGGFIEP